MEGHVYMSHSQLAVVSFSLVPDMKIGSHVIKKYLLFVFQYSCVCSKWQLASLDITPIALATD